MSNESISNNSLMSHEIWKSTLVYGRRINAKYSVTQASSKTLLNYGSWRLIVMYHLLRARVKTNAMNYSQISAKGKYFYKRVATVVFNGSSDPGGPVCNQCRDMIAASGLLSWHSEDDKRASVPPQHANDEMLSPTITGRWS